MTTKPYNAYDGLEVGQRVVVTNKSRLDGAFEGRTGVIYDVCTSNGFTRIRLDAPALGFRTVLVHPESLKAL